MFEFKSPMLCQTVKETSLESGDWSNYLVEPKYDGARCLVSVDEGGVKLWSRSGKEFTEKVPHLVEQVREAGIPNGTVFDGELAIVTGLASISQKSVPLTNFNSTMRVLGSLPERARRLQDEEFGLIRMLPFDLLYYGGESLLEKGFTQRANLLGDVELPLDFVRSPIWDCVEEDPSLIYKSYVELGGEGTILKNKESGYLFGKRPAKNQYKTKSTKEADVIVCGYKEGTGKYAGMIGSVNFGRYDNGEVVRVGTCSGMTDSEREYISNNREELMGSVFVVSYNDLVGSKEYRTPRHPQFIRFRSDKKAEECDGYEFRVK